MSLPVIAITNVSTVLTDQQVQDVMPAMQHQVLADFKGYWNMECELMFLPRSNAMIEGWWQIVIVDNPDLAGALGYHDLSAVGTPLGKVFAKLLLDHGQSWTSTFSHELLEMLADPLIDTLKQAVDNRLYALEVCDPVEADELGYKIDGVLVSDFITPRWFQPFVHGDRYSFRQNVSRPLEIAPGGYMSVWDPNQGWIQTESHGSSQGAVRLLTQNGVIPVGSRRQRRTVNFTNRVTSRAQQP